MIFFIFVSNLETTYLILRFNTGLIFMKTINYMQFFKFCLWGMLSVVCLSLTAQHSIIEKKNIEWYDPTILNEGDSSEKVFLQFSNMGDLNSETEIPFHTEVVPLPKNIDISSIKLNLNNFDYIWPTPVEHQHFIDKVNNDSINYSFSVSSVGNKKFLDIIITPVFIERDAPSFKKLKSYTININYVLKSSNSILKSSTVYTQAYADNSVLRSGNWVKVRVEESGIHKLTYSTLKDWGISNPQNVGIYGNGGKMLPSSNDEYRDDDLVENGVWHHNDAVYFYAQGPVVWEYDNVQGLFIHQKHKFSNYSYYFITEKSESSKNVETSTLQSDTFNIETDYYNTYDYHEEDNINLLKSGNVWFGEKFDYYSSPSYDFEFNFENVKPSSVGKAYAKLAGRSGQRTWFDMYINNVLVDSTIIYNVNLSEHTSYFAREGVINTSFNNPTSNLNLSLNYDLSASQSSSIGYLDYICVNVDCKLIFSEKDLSFRNQDIVGINNYAKYNIETTKNIIVWDVTSPMIPQEVSTSKSNDEISFIYQANELKEFVAFNPDDNFPSPEFKENIENQDLHATPFVDYIIVSHPDFIEQAERLGNIHNEYNGTSFVVATTEQIYNEFSSGIPDVTAIRCFVKMLYDKAGNNDEYKPKNLLLFGDGSYDNRPNIEDNTNKIPTYQSDNSIHQTNSFVSDDYMGVLDAGEGVNIKSNKVDIGIGRFPVNTIEEAKNAVDKTYAYLHNQSLEDWKNQLTFLADDGDSNVHMNDANKLTIKVDNTHPEYDITKMYFDNYEKLTVATGEYLPQLEEEIANKIQSGTLIFNYTGHGSTEVLAVERVITREKIEAWNNLDKLPVFVTATCEFSRFDDKEETTSGEMIFLNSHGGGIALFTTTRIVYSSLNYSLNNSFYDYIFEKNEDGTPYTLGQVMQHTKNNISASVNKLNFTLLGDPALSLIYPKANVQTTHINDSALFKIENDEITWFAADTLKAMSRVNIKGNITDSQENISDNFNGEIYISVYDKQNNVTTRGNNGATPFSYYTYNNIIFKGSTDVTNGQFETEFIVPKDIRYNFDNGKISYYTYSSEDRTEAFGAFSDIIVGGINEDAINDGEGPEISLWLNNRSFNNGGAVGSSPLLIADITDASGINTTGAGIGHDITCIVDEDSSNPIILNNYFESASNSYQKGSVYYQLSNLSKGSHTLTVKAWDTFNNSSKTSLTFNIKDKNNITVLNTKLYPNPVQLGQEISFSFEHDEPNSRLDTQLYIYDKDGQLVAQQHESIISLNETTPPITIETSGSNGSNFGTGLYFFKLVISSQSGKTGEVSGKFIVTP